MVRLTREQLELAIQDMRSAGLRPVMTSVSDDYLERVRAVMPLGWRETELIDFEDYVYRANDLITLQGRKYHGKRNHVARFMRTYEGRYLYRTLRACDMNECLRLWDRWYAERVGGMDMDQRLEAAQEREMIVEAFAQCTCWVCVEAWSSWMVKWLRSRWASASAIPCL